MSSESPKDFVSGSDLITVCDKCFQASCWQGIFYCDDYKTAGTVQKTRAELAALKLEHPSYWKTDAEWQSASSVNVPVTIGKGSPKASDMERGIIERAGNARAALAEKLGVPAVWPEILNAVEELTRRNQTQADSIMDSQAEQTAIRVAVNRAIDVLKMEFPGSIQRKAAIEQLHSALTPKGEQL